MSGIVGKNLGRGSGVVTATLVGADTVSGASIVDDAIDSEHYADGSIDNAHIADDAIDSEHYADGSIDNAHIADDAIDSEHYVDGSIDLAHLSADCVDGTKIADNAIDSEHYTDGSIDNAHIADDAIDSEHYADGSIDNAHIADDAIDSEHYAAGSIDEAHIANNAVTLAKMAGGTDGQIITYDASGDPVAVGPGSDGEVLTSTGAGSPPAFEASAGAVGSAVSHVAVHQSNTAQDNVTGDGTSYDILWQTEITDTGSEYASNVFTATAAGKYLISFHCALKGYVSGHTQYMLWVYTSNLLKKVTRLNPYAVFSSACQFVMSYSGVYHLDACDTALVRVQVTGSTKVVDMQVDTQSATYLTITKLA